VPVMYSVLRRTPPRSVEHEPVPESMQSGGVG